MAENVGIPPEIQETFNRLAAAVAVFGERLREITPQVLAVGEMFIAAVRDGYARAGTPYGESPEGMQRWWREACEAERLRQRAESIEQYHTALADFRQQVSKN